MQPLGRKKIQMDAKWKPKENGKHLTGWWENIVKISKRAAKFKAKQEMNKEVQDISVS
jgi:hypothetical protein